VPSWSSGEKNSGGETVSEIDERVTEKQQQKKAARDQKLREVMSATLS
jgi:hypothetical protein